MILGPPWRLIALIVLALGMPAAVFISLDPKPYEGSYWVAFGVTAVIALLQIYLAIRIYQNQARMSSEQGKVITEQVTLTQGVLKLATELDHKVFGTLTSFPEVNRHAIDLICEANAKEDSELAIMAYWMWFGVDQLLFENPDFDLATLTRYSSRVRRELQNRVTAGGRTTVVLYNPEAADERLSKFIKSVFQYQVDRGTRPHNRALSQGARRITDAEVSEVMKLYIDDVKHLNKDISGSPNGVFRPLVLKPHIPMLMFAGSSPSGWKRCLIYMGETEAIEKDADTAGFSSRDSGIVRVVLQQIRKVAGVEGPNS